MPVNQLLFLRLINFPAFIIIKQKFVSCLYKSKIFSTDYTFINNDKFFNAMFGKKQKADGNKFARWEKYRISDEEAGTMVGGSLFASYKGLLRLAKQREGEEIGEDLRDKIKTDLMIVNNCISFVDLRDDQSYAFVITSQGQLKIGEYVPSIHYALAEGQSSVKAAGTLKLNKQGKITEVLNNSGHYQPLSADNNQVFAAFSNAGLLAPGARKINLDFPEDTYKV